MAIFGGRKRTKPWQDLEGFELPRFSDTTLQILEVLRSEQGAADAVAEVIERDPGLSVRVLGMVNSAGFGARSEVGGLAHAIQLVGRASLERLVISLAVEDALPSNAPGVNGARFWQLSARRGAVARQLAAALCPSEASMHFTAAMLSDMAVPLLALRITDEYGEVLARRDAGEGELQELELEAFGWNHAEAGAWMCDQWELPKALSDLIRDHPPADGPRGPVALAGMLDEVDPEKDAGRVAEIGGADWDTPPDLLEQRILDALSNAETEPRG
jgi:HD-like signal output (HDOD) protein